jgi:D-alanyl-lipoteichoic acid acyltransferase DltB (MBOAT superfamily)
MPYSSVTITEFWRRWHISLSTWLRDYLYIPLGGNRQGTLQTYRNLFITMVLGGLWHGASWNFVFWGGLHGVALALHKAWRSLNPFERAFDNKWFAAGWTLVSRALTLSVVLVGWIFFRAESWGDATTFLQRLFFVESSGTHFTSPYILAAVLAVVIVHLVVPKDYDWTQQIVEQSIPVRALSYARILILLVTLSATDSAPFIYFQF